MRFAILLNLPERMRIKLLIPEGYSLDLDEFKGIEGIKSISFNHKTGNLLIMNDENALRKDYLISAIQSLSLAHTKKTHHQRGQPLIMRGCLPFDGDNESMLTDKKNAVIASGARLLVSSLFPLPLRPAIALYGAMAFFKKGITSLLKRNLNVDVLDSIAIGAAISIGDFRSAGIITMLLKTGDYLEEWTKDRSRRMLSGVFQIGDDYTWVRNNNSACAATPERLEYMVKTSELQVGDIVIVRTGGRIPVDGVVIDGEAMVNQASMTGESAPVMKRAGISVCAGTALEEGMLIIKARKVGNETTVSKIAAIIEEAEHLKANIQSRAETLADRLVPYIFLLSGLTYAFTGNAVRATSVLLVDYSCAIKLSTPLGIMAGMISSARKGVVIKGGKFIERLSMADIFVLDKTGTLTEASPSVIDVITFNGFTKNYVLKHAACVEEHFPHPVATAIVKKAREEGLIHAEDHSEVEYIAAHGITSCINGKRIIVGSRHFIYEDNSIDVKIAEPFIKEFENSGLSILYVAINDKLAGLIVNEDPIRAETSEFIKQLRTSGVEKIVMITGDADTAARGVAEKLGLAEYYSQILPDRKAEMIKSLRNSGNVVAMVGDGINDSAALANADVGISMKHGADVAKEACDILLLDGCLMSIITAKKISVKTMNTIRQNFKYIVGINSSLMFLGLSGISPPAFLAFMHNLSTVLAALNSLRLIPDNDSSLKDRQCKSFNGGGRC